MSLVADARLADGDDLELVVTERDRPALVRALRGLEPPVRVRRTGDSIRISLRDAGRIETAAGIRWRWERTAAIAVANRDRVARVAPAVLAAGRDLVAAGVPAAQAALSDWSHRIALDHHQLVNVAVMTLADGWGACVFDEQGTGKTVTTIACFDLLVDRGDADTLVLVAPKSMVGEWRSEFAKFCGDLYRVAVVDGSRRERVEQLHSGADVVVMGYETAVAHEMDLRLLFEKRRGVLVVDESFNIKNPHARRTDAIRRIREFCRRCFVLCGTPAPNRARDVVAQFDLVDFGYAFEGFQPSDDRDVERIAVSERMIARGLFTRNLKDTVLPNLPARSFTEVELDLEPVQRHAYMAAVDDLIVDLEAVDDDAYQRQILSFLERRLSLLRICSNPSSLLPGYDETPAKLLALDKILDDAVAEGEKVVVWSFFRDSVNAIASRYARHGLVRIDGSTTGDDRREAVRRFQSDDDTRIFLGNPAAAGAGITLHRARLAVYESIGNQAAHWMQSLDRIHRRGQEREVRYLLLIAAGTIEEDEFARVRQRATTQGELLGDPTATVPTRRVLLDILRRARTGSLGLR